MTSLATLRASHVRSIMLRFGQALRDHQQAINRLNVYPVPDGDTGTNMALTVQAVNTELDEIGDPDPDMEATCQAVSHGSLMGARGNSGVILSQVLRGLAATFRTSEDIDVPRLAEAFTASSAAAYEAVMRPVEGTILTVVRCGAEAAASALVAAPNLSLVELVDAARDGAAVALEHTPELLPVLAEAGVVDAGGTGYLLFLDVLLHVIDGRPVPEPDPAPVPAGLVGLVGGGHDHRADHDGPHVSDLRYEVMYFLEAPDSAVPAFKDVWAGIGDSIVVVGGDGIWNCHIHTDDIGASIEAAIEIGRPTKIRVTDLLEEVEEERWVREAGVQSDLPPHTEPVTTAVVAVGSGHGIMRIFHSLGVQGLVTGGQSMNPSTAQLLEAIESVPADEVVVLPNNRNIIPVARQCDSQTSKLVRVVPTTSITEGFACLLEYDPEAGADENLLAMEPAAESVISGELCQAVRDSTSDLGPIRVGDYLGMGPDGIVAVHANINNAVTDLLTVLVTDGQHEMVTVIEGDGATDAVTRNLTLWLAEHRPDVAVEVHHGGQPLYPYLFGVE